MKGRKKILMTTVYKLYTELLDYKPLIWRRFLVSNSMKLSNLAYALMLLYEARGGHLFNFYSPERNEYYALPYEEDDDDLDFDREEIDARKMSLRNVMNAAGQTIIFNYDFGDGWEMAVRVEEIFESELRPQKYPILINGEGYGIIEDCGGVYGLAEIAEAFKKKKGPEYEEYRDWLGRDNIDLKTFRTQFMNFRTGMSYFRSNYEDTTPPMMWVKTE